MVIYVQAASPSRSSVRITANTMYRNNAMRKGSAPTDCHRVSRLWAPDDRKPRSVSFDWDRFVSIISLGLLCLLFTYFSPLVSSAFFNDVSSDLPTSLSDFYLVYPILCFIPLSFDYIKVSGTFPIFLMELFQANVYYANFIARQTSCDYSSPRYAGSTGSNWNGARGMCVAATIYHEVKYPTSASGAFHPRITLLLFFLFVFPGGSIPWIDRCAIIWKRKRASISLDSLS